MAARRPFHSETELVETADQICASLEREDWLEAFVAHPRIGGVAGGGSDWLADEQSGMGSADDRVQQRLAEANREYEHRFGHIFIVCATGKSAGEMLALLDERLHNAADRELTIAAAEQRQITRLRLRKLLKE